MKISLKWLNDYIKCGLNSEETSRALTDIGLEVESLSRVESIRGGLENVVIGRVLTCEKHPDADKLSLTTVDAGEAEPLQIVCGAPNVAAGQTVVVAKVGATLYPTGSDEPFKIKRSKIRGVESLGMICAEDEIGLGTSHEGIIVLPDGIAPGTPASKYYNIEDDYILEIGLTPNRVDAASHYGVARDLAAFLKSQGQPCELSRPSVDSFVANNGDPVKVEVKDHDGAPRYSGVTIRGVKVAPSPEWLQAKLRAIGMNPHNNIVDITNFVLHEIGQPLHAFDAGKIEGGKVAVRRAAAKEKFVTLDGVERTLSDEDLMICDAVKPLCLAGVFGGIDSGVSESTTSIFLESAYFNPVSIRKSAKRHGLNTDASFRYERGADPEITIYAMKRAAQLIKELAGGEIVGPVVDICPVMPEPFRFEVSMDNVRRMIGKHIDNETIRSIITALDIKIEHENGDMLNVAVPRYRVDVTREADVVEEVLRIYGYNNVEIPVHVNSTLSYAPFPDRDKVVNALSDMLTSNGYHEIMSNSLTKWSYYNGMKAYPAENCVKILNPLSQDLNVMRQSLVFNMLEAVQLNANRRNADLKLYEFGNCYYYDAEKVSAENSLAPYREEARLAMAVTGNDTQATWNIKGQRTNFFVLKGMVEKVLKRFGMDVYNLRMETCDSDLYSEAVELRLGDKKFMEMGVISGKLKNAFDIKNDVYFLEMNFDILLRSLKKHKITASELSKYPEVKRDLALLVDESVSFSQLRKIALGAERKLLKSVSLFDVYQGDKLESGKKSYALSFILEDTTATLTDAAIEKVMSNLVAQFEKQAGAQVRS